jgi:hypothetical protein
MAPTEPVPPQREVLLRRPQHGDPRFPGEYDPQLALLLGRQQVTVVDAAGQRTTWPRLGAGLRAGPADGPAVARLRVHLRVEEPWLGFLSSKPSKVHVPHLVLIGADDRVLCVLAWSGEQQAAVARAAAAVGLLVEYRSDDAGAEALARDGVPVLKSAQDVAPWRWQTKLGCLLFLLVLVLAVGGGLYVSLR